MVTLKSFKYSSCAFVLLFIDTSVVLVSPFEVLLDSFRGPSGVHCGISRVLRGSIGVIRGFFVILRGYFRGSSIAFGGRS